MAILIVGLIINLESLLWKAGMTTLSTIKLSVEQLHRPSRLVPTSLLSLVQGCQVGLQAINEILKPMSPQFLPCWLMRAGGSAWGLPGEIGGDDWSHCLQESKEGVGCGVVMDGQSVWEQLVSFGLKKLEWNSPDNLEELKRKLLVKHLGVYKELLCEALKWQKPSPYIVKCRDYQAWIGASMALNQV